MKRLLIQITLCLLITGYAMAQGKVGIKTNLLYGAGTFTPNLGMEIGLGKRATFELSGGYNWFNLNGTPDNNKKLVHWIIQPEFRYFLCEKFNGHFLGVHALFSQYNIGQHELPMLLGNGSKDYRFEGNAFGAGLSYGYQLMLGKRWNLEFTIGVGYAQLKYDKYNCPKCGDKVETGAVRHYFGPTKAGISLLYIIK